MKKIIRYFALWLLLMSIAIDGIGQMVTTKEATRIAENWIHVIIDEYGSWGSYDTAEILPVQELTWNGRKLGYACNVDPEGYMVLSLRRELAPVKAYSPRGSFDFATDHKGEDIIKTSIAYLIDTIESRLGRIESVTPADLAPILEINYTEAWEAIYNYIPGTWKGSQSKTSGRGNYQGGSTLLDTSNNWHQHPPFNEQCPYMGCTTTSNGNAFVGCAATAASQIMYHWSWPPKDVILDPYDWPNMPDVLNTNSPQVEIDAVAELCSEVGNYSNMSYGCDESTTTYAQIIIAFEAYYRYSSNCNIYYREDFSGGVAWFESIKAQLNMNRPLEYGITGHAILCDGWRETGNPVLREYHMNWGFTGTNNDTWYTLGALPGGGIEIESYIGNIYPICSLHGSLSGTYTVPQYGHRYFNVDASGVNAAFNSGHRLQFLPEVVVKCTGSGVFETIRFDGTYTAHTRMFTGGDISRGIRIYNGTLELTNGGGLKFYDD